MADKHKDNDSDVWETENKWRLVSSITSIAFLVSLALLIRQSDAEPFAPHFSKMVLAVIENSIPILITVVVSYWLIRQADTKKLKNAHSKLVNEVTYIVHSSSTEIRSDLSSQAGEIVSSLTDTTPAIQACAQRHQVQLELVYLPTDSLHLNHIERLWNFMRRQITRNYFFVDLSALAQAAVDWLSTLPFGHFCSLMGLDEQHRAMIEEDSR